MQKEENVLAKSKEEMESGSGSEHMEGVSGNEQETEVQPQPKKKRYHRHTARQIQEMEAYGLNYLSPHYVSLRCFVCPKSRLQNKLFNTVERPV